MLFVRMTLIFGLDISFDNMWNWEGRLEKAVEGNSRKTYITNDRLPFEFSAPVTEVVKSKEKTVLLKKNILNEVRNLYPVWLQTLVVLKYRQSYLCDRS
jgi:hypothetical protein